MIALILTPRRKPRLPPATAVEVTCAPTAIAPATRAATGAVGVETLHDVAEHPALHALRAAGVEDEAGYRVFARRRRCSDVTHIESKTWNFRHYGAACFLATMGHAMNEEAIEISAKMDLRRNSAAPLRRAPRSAGA
jgi:hypothetical protein